MRFANTSYSYLQKCTESVGNSSFEKALFGQYDLEELHINLKGKNGKLVNVDYANLPIEMKRRIDYTSITIIEIKVDDEKRKTEILRQIFANLNRGVLYYQHRNKGMVFMPVIFMKCSKILIEKIYCGEKSGEERMRKRRI